jgi:NAD(P)-dependent dehydrogenase (short-subunit alcohol dehydrogenase family)
MQSKLNGKVVFITGGGRGLGEIMAKGLAREGMAIGLTARSEDQLMRVRDELKALGARVSIAVADVTNKDQLDAAIAHVEAELGAIDCLINNAGVDDPFGPVGVIDPDKWWQTQAVHVMGPMYTMTNLVPKMKAQGTGRIINVCSMAGTIVQANMSAYAVAKSTEICLSKHVAAECEGTGVSVFAIEPGTILTGMADSTLSNPDALKWVPFGIAYLKSITPEASEASKQRLQEMVVQLLSGDCDALSGQYLEPTDDFVEKIQQAATAAQ